MKNILTKYFKGIASKEEQKEILGWLRKKENRKDFQAAQKEWQDEGGRTPMTIKATTQWHKLRDQLRQHKMIERMQLRYRIVKYAAIALLVISLSSTYLLLSELSSPNQVVSTSLSTEPGQISKLEMTDGSSIWVNAGSRLTYNNQFGIENRELNITGEAYFKVAKNKKLPFEVAGGELTVTALGTEFCVSNYEESGKIEVVLAEGSVKINSIKDESFEAKLKPNEMAIYNMENSTMEIKKVNARHYIAWKDGIIHFNNATLEEVVFKLEHRYNQKFILDDDVRNLHFNLTVTNENLMEVIHILETVSGIEAKIEGDVIHLIRSN
ncbi:FecR family protein [Puteibacter caeruleilacunae]|nr:FecR family protein [Puteibacter caeruleilacunae]